MGTWVFSIIYSRSQTSCIPYISRSKLYIKKRDINAYRMLETMNSTGLLQDKIYTSISFWILIGLGLVFCLLIILWARSKRKSRRDAVRMAELDLERKKLELMAKRMLIDELKENARVPTDNEREKVDAINLDSSILTKKILHTMEEMDGRAKRLELGADTAKLLRTLGEVREQEKKLFGKDMG